MAKLVMVTMMTMSSAANRVEVRLEGHPSRVSSYNDHCASASKAAALEKSYNRSDQILSVKLWKSRFSMTYFLKLLIICIEL